MNGVLGMSELLMKTQLDSKQHHIAHTVKTSAESLLTIINDILDFSKIEANKFTLHNELFSLRDLIESLGEIFADSAQQKGLELICALNPKLHSSYSGDSFRLRQILTNLISNAIKFTESGEIVVRAEIIEQQDEQALLKFKITDTGIGLSTEAQTSVFDAFTQADSSTARRYGGSGLGLAISAKLAALMGGEMGVSSIPMQGSTFWFTVRLHKETQRDDISGEALAHRKILIVDDNATNREILEQQLGCWNCVYESVADGPAALESMHRAAEANQPFELAILDMHMPEMDGLELAKAISADPLLNPTLKVMLSSVGDLDTVKSVKDAGIDVYLTKPVRQAELIHCLVALMEKQPVVLNTPKQNLDIPQIINAKILLAEDNLVNQEVTVAMLDESRCQIDIVENGIQAVQAYKNNLYDIILMDCQMPDMDGIEATRIIRNMDATSSEFQIPIIALTANTFEGDREKCIHAGMNDFLGKPFNQDQLHDIILKWLPQGRQFDSSSNHRQQTLTEGHSSVQATFPELFDQTVLNQYRLLDKQGEKKLMNRVADAYLKQSPQQMNTLKNAITTQNFSDIKTAAHSLKSSSANIGAMTLSALYRQLENQGRENSADNIETVFKEAETLYTAVCALLPEACEQVYT